MNPVLSLVKPNFRTIAISIALLCGMLAASQVLGSTNDGNKVDSAKPTEIRTVVGTFGPLKPAKPHSLATPTVKLAGHSSQIDSQSEIELESISQPSLDGADTHSFFPMTDQSSGQVVSTKTCLGNQEICLAGRDEFWLISARQSHLTGSNLGNLCCSRIEGNQWVNASLDELSIAHSTDKSRVTVLYAHGNRTNLSWAEARGLQFYQNAFQAADCHRPPIRYVIFAWKSESEARRLYSDFRIKSQRAVKIGETYGKLLGIFDDHDLVLAGFSLGAQVVMKGLADPELSCKSSNTQFKAGQFKVALFAPAIDPSFAGGGLRQFSANPLVSQTKVFLNQRDRAKKAANLIAARGSNNVATLRQLVGENAMNSNQIRIVDITTQVTKRHSIVKYALSERLRLELNGMVNEVHSAANSTLETTSVFDR